MARPREFDERVVLDAVVDRFWTKGYGATSTRDLTDRTGLTPSSMYAAFGDKRRLFRRALDHYLGRLREKMCSLETEKAPAKAITGFFEDTIERTLADSLQRGCMLVNSALEVSTQDAEFRDAIGSELKLMEAFFRDRFRAGQERGDISHAHSADDAARQLLAVLLGIRVLARIRPERDLLMGAAGQTLQLLGLPRLTAGRGAFAKRSSRAPS
jgi:TetR/AcrR family transcriptional repressor of nem operon